MAIPGSPISGRPEGTPDEVRPRTDITRQEASTSEIGASTLSERVVEIDNTAGKQGTDKVVQEEQQPRRPCENESSVDSVCGKPDSHGNAQQLLRKVDNLEEAQVKQRLIRSVLCTRITIPSMAGVSSRVLRAVLQGNIVGLVEIVKRERLKGVAVALTADERKRTALHLAVGTRNASMVRALMRWRRELNRSLDDELDALDHHRDSFVAGTARLTPSGIGGVDKKLHDVSRFERWLSEERRRLVRVNELRCEEYWRRAVTAKDDQGRTPIHWAATVCDADDTVLQAVFTTGRANLSTYDASHTDDTAALKILKAQLHNALPQNEQSTKTSGASKSAARTVASEHNVSGNPAVFPPDQRFHRRTGNLYRRSKSSRKVQESHANFRCSRKGVPLYEGHAGLSVGTAKVEWFCGSLAKTAEKLSGRRRGGAEAFLLSVFEDFDRHDRGTLSMREFREALEDICVRVSEPTLFEIGRYFRAPTSRQRHDRHVHRRKQKQGARDRGSFAVNRAASEVSYVPLVEVAFGRREVKIDTQSELGHLVTEEDIIHSSRTLHSKHEIDWETLGFGWVGSDNDDEREGPSDDEASYVGVHRIRDVRCAILEAPDARGRSPLFLAAAAGAISAAKTLIRLGVSSALAVKGTNLTAYSVAPSPLMKQILTSEARKSLYQAISQKRVGHCRADVASPSQYASENEDGAYTRDTENEDKGKEESMRATAMTQESGGMHRRDGARMRTWVSAVSEAELASSPVIDARADHRTSLHLAAAAGLPEAVHDLLTRRAGGPNQEKRNGSAGDEMSGNTVGQTRPKWRLSSQSQRLVREEAGHETAHSANDHHDMSVRGGSTHEMSTKKADANGWSPLHACCSETSPEHYRCALALLDSSGDANPRTNTGKTPLHVAARAGALAPDGRGGGEMIPLLVSHGADVNARDSDGRHPLHIAAEAGQAAAVLALLMAGADRLSVTPRGWNALHYAVAGGHIPAARVLTYFDSDAGALGVQRNCAGLTPANLSRADTLHSATSTIWGAAALGDVEGVSTACLESARSPRHPVGKPWVCPGVSDKTPGLGFTPLHACMAGLGAALGGVDLSALYAPPRPRGTHNDTRLKDARGTSLYTRLARAWKKRTPFGDKMNAGSGADPAFNLSREQGGVRRGDERCPEHLGVCRTLLSAAADVDALDSLCRTPLFLAAAAGSLQAVEMLLEAKADPRAVDADGNSPTHFALAYANAAIAAALTKEGANLEACNKGEQTPQDVAGLRASVASREGGASATSSD